MAALRRVHCHRSKIGATPNGLNAHMNVMISTRLAILLTCLAVSPAWAHRDGCHRWHSCPSDRGTYECGDLGKCHFCADNVFCTAGAPRPAGASPTKESGKIPAEERVAPERPAR